MTREDFLLAIKEWQEQNALVDKFDELINFDHPIIDYGFRVFDMLIKTNFNEVQREWIDWWLYDRISPCGDKINEVYDEDGREINLSTPEKLWQFIENLK